MQGCCCSRGTEIHPDPRAEAISGIRACSSLILIVLKPLSPDMNPHFVRPYRIWGPKRLRIWPAFWPFRPLFLVGKKHTFVLKITANQ